MQFYSRNLIASGVASIAIISCATTAATAAATPTPSTQTAPTASASMNINGFLVSTSNDSGAKIISTGSPTASHGANIIISGPSEPKQYRFNFDFPANYNMHLAYDGSIVVDNGTSAVAQIDVPWAKDARGNQISTHFSIEGNTLVQTVEFNSNTAFPVIADPWWNPFSWNWSKIGHATLRSLKKCGLGAIGVSSGTVAANVAVNVVKNAAGKYLVSIYGGPYGLLATAAGSCVAAAVS